MDELEALKAQIASLEKRLSETAPAEAKFPEELKEKYRKLLATKGNNASE